MEGTYTHYCILVLAWMEDATTILLLSLSTSAGINLLTSLHLLIVQGKASVVFLASVASVMMLQQTVSFADV